MTDHTEPERPDPEDIPGPDEDVARFPNGAPAMDRRGRVLDPQGRIIRPVPYPTAAGFRSVAMPHARAIITAAVDVAMARQDQLAAALTPDQLLSDDEAIVRAATAAVQLERALDVLLHVCQDAQLAHDAQAN